VGNLRISRIDDDDVEMSMRSVVRFGRTPKITRYLRKNRRTQLPQSHVDIVTLQFAPSRFEDHYYTTLQDNAMYMTYLHEST